MSWFYGVRRKAPQAPRKIRASAWLGVGVAGFQLEDRTVPRPTLYLEFGDNFPSGVLTDTYGNLISGKSGSNPSVNGPTGLGAASDKLVMNSFDSLYGSGAAAARATIVSLVSRYYEPTNVEVVELKATPTKLSTGELVKGAATLAESSQLLGINNKSAAHNDTIVFITGVLINGRDQGTGGLLGISNGTDIFNFNKTEGSALTLLTDPANGVDPTNDAIDLAITAAHEAGHSFGLKHAYDTSFSGFLGPDAGMYQNSELMSYLTPFNYLGDFGAASAFFSRTPTIQGDGNRSYDVLEGANGTNGPINQFFADPDVGANPNLEYVTGSGANDLITITKTSKTQATVTVEPFSDTTYTAGIPIPGTAGKSTKYTYTIGLTKPILIDGGLGDDRITIDANLGVGVTVRGQGGDDSLVVAGSAGQTAVYVPGTNATTYFDTTSDIRGTLTVGTTAVSFSEFDMASNVDVTGVSDVTIRTPGGADAVRLTAPTKTTFQLAGTVAKGVPFVPLTITGATKVAVDLGNTDVAADTNTFTVDFTANNPIPTGGLSYIGGKGTDQIVASADADQTLSPAALQVGSFGGIALSNVDSAKLTGGKSANLFTVTNWAGPVILNGGATDSAKITADTDLTLSKNLISGSNGLIATLNAFTKVSVFGGPSANVFTTANSTLTAVLDGANGGDNYVLDNGSANVSVADSGTDGAVDKLTVVGTAKNDTFSFTANGFTLNGSKSAFVYTGIESIVADGLAGDDTFLYDVSAGLSTTGLPQFIGGPGNNTLGLIGAPTGAIAQASATFTAPGVGRIVLDPDGSGGPSGINPGNDAFSLSFDQFSMVASTVPVGQFDMAFLAGTEAIALADGAKIGGIATLSVSSPDRALLVANASRLVLSAGGGGHSVSVNLTAAVKGIDQIDVYASGGPDTGILDDGAANSFTVLASANPVTFFGQGGDDTFVLGALPGAPGFGLDAILAAVAVDGGTGDNALTLSDFGSKTGNADVGITAAGVTGLVGPTGGTAVTTTNISRLAVFGSNANAQEVYTVDGFALPLTLKTFDGPDKVTVRNVSVPFVLDTGNGASDIAFDTVTVPDKLDLTTGDGNDNITLNSVKAPGGVTIATAGGNDSISVTKLTGALAIDAGTGNNTVAVSQTTLQALTLTGGNNTVALTDVTTPGTLAVTTGDGNDTVTFIRSRGDAGIRVATNGGNDAVTVTDVDRAIDVNLGEGTNAATIRAASGPVSITSGGGSDTITVSDSPAGNANNAITISSGGGDDNVKLANLGVPATVATGDGNDTITLGDGDLSAFPAGLSIDGGAGVDSLALNDTKQTANTTYTVTALGVTRPGFGSLRGQNIEGFALLAGSGNNTFDVTGTGSGGIAITDGAGSSKFNVAASKLAGPVVLDGGGGSQVFTLDAPAGVTASSLSIANATTTNSLSVSGQTGDDKLTIRFGAKNSGLLSGLGTSLKYTGINAMSVFGRAGNNSLTLIDDTNVSYGSVLDPTTGLSVIPSGVGQGTFGVPGVLTVNYADFLSGLTVNGDGDGSGDKDTLLVTGFSTATGNDNLVLSPAVTADGADRISVSDALITIDNAALGLAARIGLATSTLTNLVIRTGNETSGGDVVTVTPSANVNIVIDAMGPSAKPGDRLVLNATGTTTIALVPTDDPKLGPKQTRVTQDSNGASVGLIGFEEGPKLDVYAVASGPGTPSLVRVYDSATGKLRFDITPYDASFLGGVSVATGDVNGDGITDIIVGAGPGGGPRVQVYSGGTAKILAGPLGSFYAFGPAFRGGVFVGADNLAGDIDADKVPDVVVGAGPGMAPTVRAYSGWTGKLLNQFQAFDATMTAGVRVALAYATDDGYADVIAATAKGGPNLVKVFDAATGKPASDVPSSYTP